MFHILGRVKRFFQLVRQFKILSLQVRDDMVQPLNFFNRDLLRRGENVIQPLDFFDCDLPCVPYPLLGIHHNDLGLELGLGLG